jgi:hypothetical protein
MSDWWEVGWKVELIPNLTKKDAELMIAQGYSPVYEGEKLVGRAYMSKCTPPGHKEGEVPMAEIKIIPTEKNDGRDV